MSRTLFRYIFWDLLRIFMLASGALSAIMTFGGLLRPLYEYGLDVGQVVKILSLSGPAMTAYSLPIAALFATTIVYGRLGADNEVTACRAAGISHISVAMPAIILGFFTAMVSLVLLCFIVPASTLRVEKVIFSNLAGLVANQIQRTHQVHFDHENQPVTVFAQGADVLPPDPKRPLEQAVRLYGPMIVQFLPAEKGRPAVPEQFYTAAEAVAYIRQDHEDDDQVTMTADLTDGTKFPRSAVGSSSRQQAMQVSIGQTTFGPMPIPSPVRENTKFMDIFRLRAMLEVPEQSRRIRATLQSFIARDQQQQYLQSLADELNGPRGSVTFESGPETYLLSRGSGHAEIRKDRLIIGRAIDEDDADAPTLATQPASQSAPTTPARLFQTSGTQSPLDVRAGEIRVRCYPDTERQRIDLDVEMLDCVVSVGGVDSPRPNFARPINVKMPANVYALAARPASTYISGSLSADDQQRLKRDLYKLGNSVISEIWARVSFAISCIILVSVGCALGLMFRSGNFLSAFAVSVVPALMCIALIVTGQHTAENVPSPLPMNWNNTLNLGLSLIWSGNVVVLVIAVVLLGRLQRQ